MKKQRKTWFKIIFGILVFFICVFSTSVHAQTKNDSTELGWFGGGIGFCDKGISLNTSFTKNVNSYFFTVRYIKVIEVSLFGPLPVEKINDFGLLIGCNLLNKKHCKIRVQAGAGIINGIKRGKYMYYSGNMISVQHHEGINYITPAIPIDASIDFCSNYFGFAISGFANINFQKAFAGVALKLLIGKLN